MPNASKHDGKVPLGVVACTVPYPALESDVGYLNRSAAAPNCIQPYHDGNLNTT
jgi:hypothetical protein